MNTNEFIDTPAPQREEAIAPSGALRFPSESCTIETLSMRSLPRDPGSPRLRRIPPSVDEERVVREATPDEIARIVRRGRLP